MRRPMVKLNDKAQLMALWRQLAALGYKRDGSTDVQAGYASLSYRMDENASVLYLTAHGSIGIVDVVYGMKMVGYGETTLTNSIPHFLAYVRTHGPTPAPVHA